MYHKNKSYYSSRKKKIWSWKQSSVYSYSKNKVIKFGDKLRTYRNLWGSVLPRVFWRWKWYMIAERVKTYQQGTFKERKLIRTVENDFFRQSSYIKKHTPWYKRIFNRYKVSRKQVSPLFQKWGWGSLLKYNVSKFHYWDVKRRNIWLRRWKPIILDEWVIRYK